ncbi:MAG: transcriptional repressor LexA [Lachnospiraceae bacterium]|jgi:repressor LexA|nr:transcriptional repressor LexA [Lachnospiraceae bacterium]MBQ5699338.1 transcriptional repressor LexA [Lachnospiraceae bacterium]MBR0307233.1 transcriptional repressor LexA [Lachnospiraceae bacterium]
MSKGKITDKQREILEYIRDTILAKGYPPAVREICEAVHLKSTSSVHSHLETLEKNGYIRRDPTKPRTIEILDDDFALTRREMVNVPVIGTVAAGMPILAEENIEDYMPIPVEMLPNKEVFMLKVKGESMIDAGIFNNDRVIVAKQDTAMNGEMVVALVDDSATVKTFYKEHGHFRLQPENASMDPIIVNEVQILGKVIGLFRMMR